MGEGLFHGGFTTIHGEIQVLPLARIQWERGLGVRELLNAKKVNEINKSSSLQPSVGAKTSVD